MDMQNRQGRSTQDPVPEATVSRKESGARHDSSRYESRRHDSRRPAEKPAGTQSEQACNEPEEQARKARCREQVSGGTKVGPESPGGVGTGKTAPAKEETAAKDIGERSKELETLLKRVQADFENYRKRIEKDQERLCRYASAQVMTAILPVLDSFDHALKACRDSGVGMLHKQLVSALGREGLRPIESVGKRFNPYLHEVLLKECKPEIDDEIVTEEIQKGYMLHDLVLRHAKVKINRREQK